MADITEDTGEIKDLQPDSEVETEVTQLDDKESMGVITEVTEETNEVNQPEAEDSKTKEQISESEIVEGVKQAEMKALTTAKLITELKDRLTASLEKVNLTDEEAIELDELNRALIKNIAEFEAKTRQVVTLVNSADQEAQQAQLPLPQEKQPEDMLPKVIICGMQESPIPKIIFCNDDKKKRRQTCQSRCPYPCPECCPPTCPALQASANSCYNTLEDVTSYDPSLDDQQNGGCQQTEMRKNMCQCNQSALEQDKEATSTAFHGRSCCMQTDMRALPNPNNMCQCNSQDPTFSSHQTRNCCVQTEMQVLPNPNNMCCHFPQLQQKTNCTPLHKQNCCVQTEMQELANPKNMCLECNNPQLQQETTCTPLHKQTCCAQTEMQVLPNPNNMCLECNTPQLQQKTTCTPLHTPICCAQTEMQVLPNPNKMCRECNIPQLLQNVVNKKPPCTPLHKQTCCVPTDTTGDKLARGQGKCRLRRNMPGVCPTDVENRLNCYSKTTSALERQMEDMVVEVRKMQHELIALQCERQCRAANTAASAEPPSACRPTCAGPCRPPNPFEQQLRELRGRFSRLQSYYHPRGTEGADLRTDAEKIKCQCNEAAIIKKLEDLESSMMNRLKTISHEEEQRNADKQSKRSGVDD